MALGDDFSSNTGTVAPAPIAPPAGSRTQTVLDTLAGAFGAPIDRMGLNSQIVAGQTRNGLVSAQTALALANASKEQEEAKARNDIGPAISQLTGDPDLGRVVGAHALSGNLKDVKGTMDALNEFTKYRAQQTQLDPNQIGTPAQTAAYGVTENKNPAIATAAPPTYQVAPGAPAPNVGQTPIGAAQTEDAQAQAKLRATQAAVGGFNPHAAGGGLNLPLDQTAALTKAIAEHRLDPMKVTSRNAGILAQAEINNPGGTIDFNRLHADANLQANPNFQQRGMVVDALPQMIQRMVDSGKKLSYPDLQVAGEAKKWMLGQSNDPDLAEYMAQRNDTLMNLASVMRGVGMSDQAHSAEIEAAAPTLSPRALEGWARGQLSAVMPRYAAMHRISDSHAAPAPGATPTPAAPAPGATPTPAAAPAAPAAPPAGKVLTPQEYLAQFGKH